jgi:hypothetical protein
MTTAHSMNFQAYLEDTFRIIKEEPVILILGGLVVQLLTMLTMGILAGPFLGPAGKPKTKFQRYLFRLSTVWQPASLLSSPTINILRVNAADTSRFAFCNLVDLCIAVNG